MSGTEQGFRVHRHSHASIAKRRHGIRIDLTPMVDVAFLLLTFFMLTTSLMKHQAMEVNIPPKHAPGVPLAESHVLIIRVTDRNDIFWNVGREAPVKAGMNELRNILLLKNQLDDNLVTILKVDRRAKYHMLIDMLDEMQLSNVGRYSISPMDDVDRALMGHISL